jgi:hypothetical protein
LHAHLVEGYNGNINDTEVMAVNIKSNLKVGEISSIVFFVLFSIFIICLLFYFDIKMIVLLGTILGIILVAWMIIVVSCQYAYKLELLESEIEIIQFFFVKRKIDYSKIKTLMSINTLYRDGSIHKSLKIIPMHGFSIRLNYDRINSREIGSLVYLLKDRTNLQILEQKGYY